MTSEISDFSNSHKQLIFNPIKCLTARLRKFSDETVHQPSVLTAVSDVSLEKGSVIKFIIAAYYGNGNNDDNKGYVSIVFQCMVPLFFKKQLNFTFSCTVAVKDVSGSKRFIRTFTFPYDVTSHSKTGDELLATYSIDQYIKRETLLEDHHNLLPEDCLSLIVEVKVQDFSLSDNSSDLDAVIDSSLTVEEDAAGDVIMVLSLNSDVAQSLYENSCTFRAMCDTPMIESSQGFVHLPDDNIIAFKNACKIIMGAKAITFDSFDEIIILYIFADKYDLQKVVIACRNFFKNILLVNNSWGNFDPLEAVGKLMTIANFFEDDYLKEIIGIYHKNQVEQISETRPKCDTKRIKLGNLICEYAGQSPYFCFELEEEKEDYIDQFDFYQ